MEVEIKKFEKGKSYKNCWIVFRRDQINDVMYGLENFIPDCWLSVRLNDEFYDYLWCGEPNFYRVKILRHVLAPYVKDGKPRGWFKGTNGEPLRWTSLGNIIYIKGENAEAALKALLTALVAGEVDERFFIKFKEDDEEILGFAPVKGQYATSESSYETST